MPLFSNRRPDAFPAAATAADLAALGARLEALSASLDAHCVVTGQQGEMMIALPEAIMVHVRAEIAGAARDVAHAAWVALKTEAVKKGFSWAVTGLFGALTAYALTWVHTILGWVSAK